MSGILLGLRLANGKGTGDKGTTMINEKSKPDDCPMRAFGKSDMRVVQQEILSAANVAKRFATVKRWRKHGKRGVNDRRRTSLKCNQFILRQVAKHLRP